MKATRWAWAGSLVLSLTCCTESASPPSTSPSTFTTTPITTHPPVASTSTPTSAATIPDPITLPNLDPAQNDLEVTTAPYSLDPDLLVATEGMILGVNQEIVFEDGARGGGPVVLRVEDGQAQIVRGRWCGTDWGPAPLDDLRGGTVVAPYEMGYEVVRCSPGQAVQTISSDTLPAATAMIDGKPVVALISSPAIEPKSGLDLMDLATGAVTTLIEVDGSLERPMAASRSEDGLWVVTLTDVNHPRETVVRYAFTTDAGRLVEVAGNPQPDYPADDNGYGAAAMTPDGRLLTLQRGEGVETDLVLWDLEIGAEVDRFHVLSELPQGTPAPSRRYAHSVYADATRAVVHVQGVEEEEFPFGIVLVDLASGSIMEISGPYENVWVQFASFIRP